MPQSSSCSPWCRLWCKHLFITYRSIFYHSLLNISCSCHDPNTRYTNVNHHHTRRSSNQHPRYDISIDYSKHHNATNYTYPSRSTANIHPTYRNNASI